MTIAYSIEHVSFENPAFILTWLDEHNIPCHALRPFKGEHFVDPVEVDLLIIMGGPMNIYEEEQYPWLKDEKKFIKAVIDMGVPVLGICLGAQLIADVLGGRVTRTDCGEYGWHKVKRVLPLPNCSFLSLSRSHNLYPKLPDFLDIFQWHQDTFVNPPDSVHLYTSTICQNQAFIYKSHVIGLQFHPELDETSIRKFLKQSEAELSEKGLDYLIEDITLHINLCTHGHRFISDIMDYLTRKIPERRK